jgi:hypothetical protein
MTTQFKNTDAKLFNVQNLRVYASVFLTASLLLAMSSVKAEAQADAATIANSSKPASAPTYVFGAPSYTAKKSITLDGLMKEVYPNSPLHAAILSKALHTANPKLLNGKVSQSIQRGVTLNIPNHTQLVVDTLAPYAPPPPVAIASPSPEANSYGSQSSDPSARRLWVRFP